MECSEQCVRGTTHSRSRSVLEALTTIDAACGDFPELSATCQFAHTVGKTTLLRALVANEIKGLPKHAQVLHVEQEIVGDDTSVIEVRMCAPAHSVVVAQMPCTARAHSALTCHVASLRPPA